jgi:hypothetical protein
MEAAARSLIARFSDWLSSRALLSACSASLRWAAFCSSCSKLPLVCRRWPSSITARSSSSASFTAFGALPLLGIVTQDDDSRLWASIASGADERSIFPQMSQRPLVYPTDAERPEAMTALMSTAREETRREWISQQEAGGGLLAP